MYCAHNELKSLLSTDSHAGGDALITPDSKSAHCVPCLPKDWLLACELFQHLRQIGVTLSALTSLSPFRVICSGLSVILIAFRLDSVLSFPTF